MIVSVVVCAGCQPSVSESTVDVPPIHLRYDSSSPVPCAGTASFLADTANRQAAYLGLPAASRIEYHYWANRDFGSHCPSEGPACAALVNGIPTIWSHYASVPHELVHALVFPIRPVRFFAEALAVALGGDDGNGDMPPYSFTPEQLIDNDGADVPTIAFYGIAGDFGSYLLDRWQPSRFAQLNPLIPAGTTASAVDGMFAMLYGEDMSHAFAERQASGARYAGDRLGFPECGEPTTAWTQSGWTLSQNVDCSTGGISSSDDATGVTTYSTFDVPAPDFYAFSFHGDAGSRRFSLQRCTSGEQFDYFPAAQPDLTHVEISGASPLVFGWLPRQRHFLRYVAGRESPSGFTASIHATTDAADRCTGSSTLVDSSVDGIYAVAAWDGPSVVVPFEVSADRSATAVVRQATLFVCDGSCDASGAGCRMVSSGDAISLLRGHSYAIVTHGNGLHAFAGVALSP